MPYPASLSPNNNEVELFVNEINYFPLRNSMLNNIFQKNNFKIISIKSFIFIINQIDQILMYNFNHRLIHKC